MTAHRRLFGLLFANLEKYRHVCVCVQTVCACVSAWFHRFAVTHNAATCLQAAHYNFRHNSDESSTGLLLPHYRPLLTLLCGFFSKFALHLIVVTDLVKGREIFRHSLRSAVGLASNWISEFCTCCNFNRLIGQKHTWAALIINSLRRECLLPVSLLACSSSSGCLVSGKRTFRPNNNGQ